MKDLTFRNDRRVRLTTYWIRCLVMRKNMYRLYERAKKDPRLTKDEWFAAEYTAFSGYWLASLFVVVEGYNKIGIHDERVAKLLSAHVHALRAMRHEMFHFQLDEIADGKRAFKVGKWAEELHAAIGEHLGDHLTNISKRERAQRVRDTKKRPRTSRVRRRL